MRDFDITDRLSDIKAPLLLITGAEDKATPLSEAKLISDTCANAKLITIENASHLAMVEKPHEFDSALLNFFSTVHQWPNKNN